MSERKARRTPTTIPTIWPVGIPGVLALDLGADAGGGEVVLFGS